MGNPDREDITDQYKYPEETRISEKVMERARANSTKPTHYTEDDSPKVKWISSLGSTFINAQ